MSVKEQRYLIAMMIFCCLANVRAQEPSSGEKKRFPAQISLVSPIGSREQHIFDYPIGTHGRQSFDYIYNFSLNILTGNVGGINGLEISGLMGQVEGDVNGVQLAGLGNVAGGNVNGIQIAGLGNVSNHVRGIQISGLGNVTDNVTGLQFTGLGNITDHLRGIQVAGLGNITNEMNGLQFSGFGNISADAKGLQVGGIANICDAFRGLQVGGLANVADNVSGLQVTGLANVADNMAGLQVGGLFNISADVSGVKIAGISNISDNVSGVNIGGIYNRTRTLRGFQFGLVSITDTIEKGISLAIVNIVKKDFYNEWELSFSDYANVALSYKMGAQKFYTIYTVGASFIKDDLWLAGIGFGNRTPLNHSFDFQPELIFHTYLPSDFKNVQYTSATHLKLGFVYNFNDKLGLSLAPSVYVMNADKSSVPGSEYYKVSPFGALYTHEKDNSRITIGLGVSLGLVLK